MVVCGGTDTGVAPDDPIDAQEKEKPRFWVGTSLRQDNHNYSSNKASAEFTAAPTA